MARLLRAARVCLILCGAQAYTAHIHQVYANGAPDPLAGCEVHTTDAVLYRNLSALLATQADAVVLLLQNVTNAAHEAPLTARRPTRVSQCLVDPPAGHVGTVSQYPGSTVSPVEAYAWVLDACAVSHLPRTSRLQPLTAAATQQSPLERWLSRAAAFNDGSRMAELAELPAGTAGCRVLNAANTSAASFFHDIVHAHMPTLLRSAHSWPALHTWTWARLLETVGKAQVHVKASPNGIFEGSEPAHAWCPAAQTMRGCHEDMPQRAFDKLAVPERVVGRPAALDMPFKRFAELTQTRSSRAADALHDWVAGGCHSLFAAAHRHAANRSHDIDACLASLSRAPDLNLTGAEASFYIEYLSLAAHLPRLLRDIGDDLHMDDNLRLRLRNIWVGDGRTIGKLHFDPYENLLVPIAGSKTFVLLPPYNNSVMLETHLREAQYEWSPTRGVRRREGMMSSTSMVNTPLELTGAAQRAAMSPEHKRVFSNAIVCTVAPGDMLYVPSWWWHEVISAPDPEGKNIAVNYWYEPVFAKEYPCANCTFRFNYAYAASAQVVTQR